MFRVNLTYFKESGRLYSSGALLVEDTLPFDLAGLKAGSRTPLYRIWNVVHFLLRRRSLPGLVENHSPFIVLVEVPDHPNNHPHLIFPDRPYVPLLPPVLVNYEKLNE